jgi:hypothetical protein
MYRYKISLDVYGAEVTVGSVSFDAYAYWITKDKDSLENHLVSDEESNIDEAFSLYPWFERDNLIHTYGVEFSGSNSITVTEELSSDTILECDLDHDWVKDASWVINDKSHVLEKDTVLLTCVSWEKGTWEYELIETEKPFDQSKLEFYLYHIDGMFIVDHLRYEGIELSCDEASTRGVGFSVWFD